MKPKMKKYFYWSFEFLCITAIGLLSLDYFVPNFNIMGHSIPLFIIPLFLIIIEKYFELGMAQNEELLCTKSQIESQLGILWQLLRYNSEASVRCTIHVPTDDNHYSQIVDYYPTRTGSGRKFEIDKGIVAKSIAGKLAFVERFENVREYHEKSKEIYNYTESDLINKPPEKRSYFCYPIGDSNGKILGVIYFDSVLSNTFSSKSSERSKFGPYDIDENDRTYQQVHLIYDQIKTKVERYLELV